MAKHPVAKARWFPIAEEFDFRVGGREIIRSADPDGPVYTSIATYQEIVPDARIVYTFNLDMDEKRISVSLMTVEFKSDGSGTKLIYTEQCAFFDKRDSLEVHLHGSKAFLDQLDIELERAN